MARKVVSFSLRTSTVVALELEGRKYPGTKSDWTDSILRHSLHCIKEKGFDEFRKILNEGG